LFSMLWQETMCHSIAWCSTPSFLCASAKRTCCSMLHCSTACCIMPQHCSSCCGQVHRATVVFLFATARNNMPKHYAQLFFVLHQEMTCCCIPWIPHHVAAWCIVPWHFVIVLPQGLGGNNQPVWHSGKD